MTHYDVIIIGAGPTGLMAANQLARFGINFLIIDSKAGPTVQSRAIVVNGKERAMATIGEFGKGLTDFSYMLAFEQSRNEELLTSHLATLDNEVSWNTQLENIEQTGDVIEADLKYLTKPGAPVERSQQTM